MVKAIIIYFSFFTLWTLQRKFRQKCREAMYLYWILVLVVLTHTEQSGVFIGDKLGESDYGQ